jgi:hypothetical protein
VFHLKRGTLTARTEPLEDELLSVAVLKVKIEREIKHNPLVGRKKSSVWHTGGDSIHLVLG